MSALPRGSHNIYGSEPSSDSPYAGSSQSGHPSFSSQTAVTISHQAKE